MAYGAKEDQIIPRKKASGQNQMRKVDGWEPPSQPNEPIQFDLAA